MMWDASSNGGFNNDMFGIGRDDAIQINQVAAKSISDDADVSIALDNDFTSGNFEFSAQASAVAVTAGASADVDYNNGVAIFTMAKGGLMYEASVGGQKFSFEPIK